MTSDPWKDFGYAVRQARLGRGWSLEELASEALGNGARKGYVSQVEKGARNLSPETIDKFDQALDLPADVVKAAHLAPPPAKTAPDEDKRDQDAERLLARVARDETVAPVAEALLTTLAYEFAGGEFCDLQTAYVSLRQALEAAEKIRKRGEMPPDNTGSQFNAVIAEVAKLNDAGERDEADALLDAEERRMREAHATEKDRLAQQAAALLDRRLDQDRLRNRPDLAAQRLIRDLHRQAPPGGVFWATDRLSNEWSDNGDAAGDIFALRVALELAKANYEKSKGKKALEAAALRTLKWAHYRLAQRSTNDRHLIVAKNALEASLKKTSRHKEPLNWAARQDGLGNVLSEKGERASDPDLLKQATTAHRAALNAAMEHKSDYIKSFWNNLGIALQKLGEITRSPETLKEAEEALTTARSIKDKVANALDWESSQNNLALAQRWRGAVTSDMAKLEEARAGFAACETQVFKDKAAFRWARLQWNIADLALTQFRLDPNPAYLDEARNYLAQARAIFVEGSDYQTQRCDDLLADIDAAQAA